MMTGWKVISFMTSIPTIGVDELHVYNYEVIVDDAAIVGAPGTSKRERIFVV